MHHRSPLPLVPGQPQKHPRKSGDEQSRSRAEGKSGLSFQGDNPNPSAPPGSGKGNGVVGMKPQSQPSRRRPRHCHGGLVTLGPAPGPPVTADPHQAGGGPASLPPAPQGPGAGTPVASCRLLHAREDRAPGQLRPESGCVHTITDRDSKP